MGYEATYDADDQLVYLKVIDVYTADDARAFSKEAETLLGDNDIRQIAVDLSKAGKFDGTEARRTQAEQLKKLRVQSLAMYNARPAVRIMGKILTKLAGGDMKADFFTTQDEAVTWLKQERKQA